jgi:hypothetical protein
MSRAHRTARALVVVLLVGSLACADAAVDPRHFEGLGVAMDSVRADIRTTGVGSQHLQQLLRTLDVQLEAAGHQVRGRREATALRGYREAAEAYKYLLRFRNLEADGPGGTLLLRGANQPIALRYKVPFTERGGGRWVNRKNAMDVFAAKADVALAEVSRILQQTDAR